MLTRIALIGLAFGALTACSRSASTPGGDTASGGSSPSVGGSGVGGSGVGGSGVGGSPASGGESGGSTCGAGGAVFTWEVNCFCPGPQCDNQVGFGPTCVGMFPELWDTCEGGRPRDVGDSCNHDFDCWHSVDVSEQSGVAGSAGSAGSAGTSERLGCGNCPPEGGNCPTYYRCELETKTIPGTEACTGVGLSAEPLLVSRGECNEGACLEAEGRSPVCVGSCSTDADCPDGATCRGVPSYTESTGIGSRYQVCVPD